MPSNQVVRVVMHHRGATLGAAALMLGVTVWPALRLGTEFMPALDEGSLLFMPTTLPGVSVTRAAEISCPVMKRRLQPNMVRATMS